MKKATTIIAILLGMTLGAMAQQNGGGLFRRGIVTDETYSGGVNRTETGLMLPVTHGEATDQNGTPVGGGIAILVGLGAAYVMKKRREE